jgi:hypothetical protein
VLILAALHITRLVESLRLWDFLFGLYPVWAPAYGVVSGAVWGLVLLPLGLAIWLGSRRVLSALPLIAGLYLAFFWLERLVWSFRAGWAANTGFLALASLGLIVWLWQLFRRPKILEFFGEVHEQSSQDPKAS